MKDKKTIYVDFNNLQSIAKADRLKTQLENQGYIQTSIKPTGYDKFNLVYEK